MSLHRLGVGGPLHHVASLYGVGKSTLCKVFRDFIRAILKHRNRFISWPNNASRLQAIKDGFEEKQGFPNCCGALDVTHINIELLYGETHVHGFDRNKRYSMSIQAVVDSQMRFLDVMAGMPGCCNDIRVLRNSKFHA